MKIQSDARVEIHYKLFDVQGELVESTEKDDPVVYHHGRKEVLPGLEQALEGAGVGELRRFTLAPVDAYGEHNPEGIVAVPRSELPAEHEYAVGDWLTVSVTEEEAGADDEEEGEIEMRVVEVHEEEVILDANHPLAGQPVTFEVEVLSVETS